MAKLEAMLEQRGIATPRELSEAIARCQLHGGDLTTSLLQFVSADETQLSAALSECYGLPPATVGLLPAPDDAALRSLPRDVAERYCCFPLEATPGRLVLAVAHPLEPALREELGFTLGVSIEERVALEVRIRQALARFYGLPLSARNQRGIARLEGDVDAANLETPLGMWSDAQLSALPRPPSELTAPRDSQRPPSVRPRSRSETPRHGSTGSGTSVPPPSSGTRTSRRRGPLSLAQARDELGRAGTRNDVLDIFFGFASQFFEYSALFAVHNALAEGLDAWGKGADRETVLGIGVPLDLPSSLSEVAESCKVRLTRLGKEGIDRTLASDLQRQFNTKALVLPVSLRGRCAVLLYADNGEADVVEREVADVIAIAPDVANALGRIILQRKKEVARQKAPDDGDLASLARRPPSSDAKSPHSDEPGRVPALLDGLEPIPNENRERSRNNARRNSRPEASPAPLRPEREGASVLGQPVVSIGPNGDGASPSPPAGDVRSRDPGSSDDPVFLLARPQDRARVAAVPHEPRPLPVVAKPPVSITHPAPIIGNRPRLPSVIVEPESADPEASERMTRAAAVTRAPSQGRNGPARRPHVPLLADAPRTLGPPAHDRLVVAKPARRGERPAPAQVRDDASRESREREARAREAQPSEPEPDHAVEEATQPASSRPALHPTSVELSEPPPAESLGTEATRSEPAPNGSESEPPTAAGAEAAAAEADREDEDELDAPSSNAWPPPIMDNSPPPRQPPLTALVPIIIADNPKSRRGHGSRTAATARPGGKPGLAKSPLPRATPSSSPPGHGGPSSPTVPSPGRARKLDPAANAPVASANQTAANPPSPFAVAAATPVALAAPVVAAAPADANGETAPLLDEALPALPIAEAGASAAVNGGSRLTNAIARAAARAASSASSRGSDPLARSASEEARLAAAATTAPVRAAQPSGALAPESPARRDSRPPPAPAMPARSAGTPPPLQTRGNAGAHTPRLVLPSMSGERASRPPPAPVSQRSMRDAGARDVDASDELTVANTAAAVGRASAPPSSTILGLGAASASSPAEPSPAESSPAEPSNAVPAAAASVAAPVSAEAAAAQRSELGAAVAPSSTLIGVAAPALGNGRAAAGAPVPSVGADAAAGSRDEPANEGQGSGISSSGISSRVHDAGARREPAATTELPTPRALQVPGVSSAPPPALAADDSPPDSVELAWDALISQPPPAGSILASSRPPAAPPAAAQEIRSPGAAPASLSAVSAASVSAASVSATPASTSLAEASVASASALEASPRNGDASRPSQPPPSPASMPFGRSASAPPAPAVSAPAPSSPIHPVPSSASSAPSSPIHPVPSSASSAPSSPIHPVPSSASSAPSSPIHPVPSSASPAPSSPIHPVPSHPMSASSSNRSAAPSSANHPLPSSASPAPSDPIPALPSRSIDAAPNSGERTPSRTGQEAPSRPGSGSRPALSSPSDGPASRPGAPPPSSVATLAPPSARGEARGAIFPPPPGIDPEIEDLVEQVCQGNLRAVQDLARIGAASVPQVMARFPGPVISERAGPSSRASECGPLLQALAAIGSPAMPSISLSSENADARVRRWATLLLGEMPGPEACRAVVQRLADDVPRVHQAALDAARLLLASSAADLFRKTLFEVAEAEDAPLTLRLRTLEHVAKLKDSASVPRLITFLGADMEPIVHKALWALTVVTRHDFGRDAGAWTAFWEANRSRHRTEWLIDALDGRDPRLRKTAADELREEAGELFGYAEDQARPERLEAQQAFRRWWQTVGAARHTRL